MMILKIYSDHPNFLLFEASDHICETLLSIDVLVRILDVMHLLDFPNRLKLLC